DGHADVPEHDIVAELAPMGQTGSAIGRLGDDGDVLIALGPGAPTGSDQLLVVDEDDAHRGVLCHGLSSPSAGGAAGGRARTAGPHSPGPAAKSPPRRCTRSRMPRIPVPSTGSWAGPVPSSAMSRTSSVPSRPMAMATCVAVEWRRTLV